MDSVCSLTTRQCWILSLCLRESIISVRAMPFLLIFRTFTSCTIADVLAFSCGVDGMSRLVDDDVSEACVLALGLTTNELEAGLCTQIIGDVSTGSTATIRPASQAYSTLTLHKTVAALMNGVSQFIMDAINDKLRVPPSQRQGSICMRASSCVSLVTSSCVSVSSLLRWEYSLVSLRCSWRYAPVVCTPKCVHFNHIPLCSCYPVE